jgi:hypothetical protein
MPTANDKLANTPATCGGRSWSYHHRTMELDLDDIADAVAARKQQWHDAGVPDTDRATAEASDCLVPFF